MKIKDVESLAGITKKNIRFYEEQGLLSPKRNSENGYREYTQEDIAVLRRIKLLRKLGISIDETRQILCGTLTVGDGMRRHLISLERERRNIDQSITLCSELQTLDVPISQLDTESWLLRMEEMEQVGASFQNKQKQDVHKQYLAPILAAVIVILFMLAFSMLFVWAYVTDPGSAPPFGFVLLLVGIFLAIGGGVMLALFQRIREIGKGEIDDAKYY
ncbi:MAG: MerR family transcriptional regulator [Lachnospiraceae bacterium]|nr:MerR family transcriptional regulator [Lachnospiraceae bacterium]